MDRQGPGGGDGGHELSQQDGQGGVERDMIVEEKEVMNARKLAISIKSRFCVTGRDTGVQAGLHTGEQPVQEEEV